MATFDYSHLSPSFLKLSKPAQRHEILSNFVSYGRKETRHDEPIVASAGFDGVNPSIYYFT